MFQRNRVYTSASPRNVSKRNFLHSVSLNLLNIASWERFSPLSPSEPLYGPENLYDSKVLLESGEEIVENALETCSEKDFGPQLLPKGQLNKECQEQYFS